MDENWYHGEMAGVHGFFPTNFVQVIKPLPQPPPQCKALYDFELKDKEADKDCLPFSKVRHSSSEAATVLPRGHCSKTKIPLITVTLCLLSSHFLKLCMCYNVRLLSETPREMVYILSQTSWWTAVIKLDRMNAIQSKARLNNSNWVVMSVQLFGSYFDVFVFCHQLFICHMSKNRKKAY